jgi:hypothetical protein
MSKKTGGIFAFLGLLGLSVFLLSCGTKVSRSSGLLFVVSQASNQVNSYAINQSTGNLSFLKTSASTCAAAACGFPLNILLDPSNATAFVLNQGVPSGGVVPSIYAYTVNSDGSLKGAGDVTPPSVFASGDQAVAMTRDAGGRFLFILTQGNPKLIVLGTTPGSTSLSLIGQTVLTRVPTSVFAITFTPPGATAAETLLYITSNKDLIGSNDNTVSEYIVDQSSGTATELTGSPYVTGTGPSAVLAVDTNPAGANTGGLFAYVTNQTTNNVSAFQVCLVQNGTCTAQDVANATMLPVGSPVPVNGQAPIALVGDPTNNFLYVVCETSNQVFAFRIGTATGVLSALNPPFVGTGSFPVAMAMHPTGTFLFLYVSNNASSNLSGFTVNTTSGQLGNPITVISLGQPAGLVAK